MLNARNVVIFDNAGIPSIMVRFNKCTNAELFVGGSERIHPAFVIDGQEVDAIYISKYPCTMINGKPYSLPCKKLAASISADDAAAACYAKGKGWHMLTAPEYALVALTSIKGGTPPRGNTNYGKSHSRPGERGECYDGSHTLTGSGPVTWAHNHTPYGVYDICGNVWEMIAGLRLMDGRIEVVKDNDAANQIYTGRTSPLWTPILADGKPTRFTIIDDEIRLTNDGGGSDGWDYCRWKDLQLDIEPPELLKALALCPEGAESAESYLFVDPDGLRLPFRGGGFHYPTGAGVAALFLDYLRSYVSANVGFRAAYFE
jgi:hypothetical protein